MKIKSKFKSRSGFINYTKIFSSLLIISFLLCLTGCACKMDYEEAVFNKIGKNLYEVTYYDYDLNYSAQNRTDPLFAVSRNRADTAPGGCSAIHVGNYVGRNLDLAYGDYSEVVVHVPSSKNRYASVGSFNTLMFGEGETLRKDDLGEDIYNMIPLCICDGINEKGVVCEINVTPAKDIGFIDGTNPGKPTLNFENVVRFVLDNAASAEEAVSLLDDYNICIPWDWTNMQQSGYEPHFLIADEKDSYVVEVINNKVVATKGENVLTNYYIGIEGGTNSGQGIERYQTLKANSNMADSVDGMARLMELVYWSKSNDTSGNICYSDHFGTIAKDGTEINKSNYEKYKNELIETAKLSDKLTKEMIITGKNEDNLWLSVHTCVFDIKNKTMRFSMDENTENIYDFELEAK